MVKDKTNRIYTDLYNHMKSLYPNLDGGTEYNEKVKLPFMHFFMIDNPTALTTLSDTEDGTSLSYQIDIYTKDDKAREMANKVREFMIGESFTCRQFMPFQSSSNVSRFITRFRRLDV